MSRSALRTLCGLTTVEVARLFLSAESAMQQRLVRAKRRLADADVPYRVPAAHELPARLPAVLATIELLFTEGHNATSGPDHVRAECCDEAVRLARLLAELMPDEPEVLGLLALLLLTDARRATRTDADGDLVLLADQDRATWDHDRIDDGVALIERALRMQASGAVPAAGGHRRLPHGRPLAGDDRLEGGGQPTRCSNTSSPARSCASTGPSPSPRPGVSRPASTCSPVWMASTTCTCAGRSRRICAAGPATTAGFAADAYRRALACRPNDAERRFLERQLAELAPGP